MELASDPRIPLCSSSTSEEGDLLELTNLKSGETHLVSPEGAIIGRAGAKADIALRDPGVSKKHARVYERAGVWYLQDEGSSNGTFLQGQRLTGPVALAEGSVFGMSRHKFKVTRIEAEGTSEQPQVGASLYGSESFLSEPSAVGLRGSTGVSALDVPRTSANALPSLAPLEAPEEAEAEEAAADPPTYGAALRTNPDAAPPPGAQVQAPSSGAAFVRVRAGFSRALPFLVSAVPGLVVSPRKSTADMIRTLPQEDMGGATLVGFALPAFGVLAVFQGLCTFLTGLLSSGEALFAALFPWVALLAAGVSAVVAGLLFHPITGWLFEALRGASDARERSNLFANMLGALVLSQGASGVALLLAAVPWPGMALVAAALQAWTTLVTVIVLHLWLQHFRVLAVARHAVVALGTASALAIGGLGVASSFGETTEGAPLAQAPSAQEGPPSALTEQNATATPTSAGLATTDSGALAASERAEKAARAEPVEEAPPLPKAPADFAYPQFRDRRDKMEDALNRDVTLLSRVRGALEAYRAFHRVKHEVERRYEQANEENPDEVRVNERLAEQELYLRGHAHVQAFWQAVERYRP